MKLVLLHGLPASGKSTLVAERFTDAVVVSHDALRSELAGPGYHSLPKQDKAVEDKVTTLQRERIVAALTAGQTVVVDDTNTSVERIRPLVELAHSLGAEVEHVHVDVPVEVCKERNRARGAAGGREVPEFVIDRMAKQGYTSDGAHLLTFRSRRGKDKHGNPASIVWTERDPSVSHEVELVEFNATITPRTFPETPAKAIVFDMDGTLADVGELVVKHIWDRRDFHRFHTESEFSPANEWVVEAARKAHADGYAVLVVTARQATYVGPTTRWLVAHGVPLDRLYMRAHGDMRPDFEAKRDIVGAIEAEGFTIVHAYDDNPQVIRLWEELGVPTTVVPNPQWSDPRAHRKGK